MTAGIGAGTAFGISRRDRNSGAGPADLAPIRAGLGGSGPWRGGLGSAATGSGRARFNNGGNFGGTRRRRRIVLLGGRHNGAAGATGSTARLLHLDGPWAVRARRRGAGLPASPPRTAKIRSQAPLSDGKRGHRCLPLERVEPPGDGRDRPPAIADVAVRGPGRIVQRAHRAQSPSPGAAGLSPCSVRSSLRHQQSATRCVGWATNGASASRALMQIRMRRSRPAQSPARPRCDLASSPPASRRAPAAGARNRRVLHAHRHRRDRDAAAPAMPSRPVRIERRT